MYKFQRHTLGWLAIHAALPAAGDVHRKVFMADTPSHLQRTLNVYIGGRFELAVGDFRQVLTSGQTNLDLRLQKFPARIIVQETALDAGGIRLCLQPRSPEDTLAVSVVRAEAGKLLAPDDGFVLDLTTAAIHRELRPETTTRVCVITRT